MNGMRIRAITAGLAIAFAWFAISGAAEQSAGGKVMEESTASPLIKRSDDTGPGGSVTLPWKDVKPLLQPLFGVDDKSIPPVPYLLESARLEGVIHDNHVEITGQYIFNVLEVEGWVEIPVAAGDSAIKDIQMDGHPVGLSKQKDALVIVTNEPGRHTLELTLRARITGSGKTMGSVRIPIVSFPQSSLKLQLPGPDYDVMLPQAASMEIIKEDKETFVNAVIRQCEALDISWDRKVTVAEGAKLPTKLTTRVFTMFSVGEGLITINDRVNYSILYNPVTSIKVEIPGNSTVTSIDGTSVKGWKILKDDAEIEEKENPKAPESSDTETKDDNSEMENGEKETSGNDAKAISAASQREVLEITFGREIKGEGSIQIIREMPYKEDADTLTLPEIQPLGAERTIGWIGVSTVANVECTLKGSQKLTMIDVEEVPSPLNELTIDPIVLAFKFTSGPVTLTLNIRRFETLPVLSTIIDHAAYKILMTEDGKLVTQVDFQTRNNRNQYLQVSLPENAEIWNSFVAGAPVKPARDDDGNLLLLLKKSFSIEEQSRAFPVRFTYLQELKDFQQRGKMELALAKPDVPVSRVLVTLFAPENFKLSKFSGTLKRVDKDEVITYSYKPQIQGVERYAGVAVVEKEEIAFSRRAPQEAPASMDTDIKGASPFAGAAAYGRPSAPQQQAQAGTFFFNYETQPTKVSRGLLPIPIDIPQEGKPYYFGKILTTGEDFQVNFNYRKKRFVFGL